MPAEIDPDVFVSYAWRDNQPPPVHGVDPKRHRWVWMFADALEAALGMKLGRDARVWVDREGIGISDKPIAVLTETLQKCPLLLALVSPSWLASQWCPQELSEFRRTHPGTATAEDVLVVLIEHVEREEWTPHVDVNGMLFYRELPPRTFQRLGHPVPSMDLKDHREFFDQVTVLAGELSARLSRIRKAAAATPQEPDGKGGEPASRERPLRTSGPRRPALWLADIPASLAAERRSLVEAVRQAGFDVHSPGVLDNLLMPHDAACNDLRDSMQDAAVLVQLLDHEPFRKTPDGLTWAHLMADEASATARRLLVPFIQWRRPGSFSRAVGEMQRELLEGAIEPSIEELRTSVLALLRDAGKAATEDAASGIGTALLCMAYAEDDTDVAHDVGRMLDELEVDYESCVTPSSQADPYKADHRSQFEDRLMQQASGVIIIHGRAAQEWLNTTVVRLKQLRGRKGRWGALIDSPPADKPLPPPQSMIQRLDWRQQPRFELLQQFVESLQVGRHG